MFTVLLKGCKAKGFLTSLSSIVITAYIVAKPHFRSLQGVRVVLAANFPTEKLGSKELRTKWIKNLTKEALARHADGVNIDIESPIPKRSREVTLLTKLVNETKIAFQSVIKNAQVKLADIGFILKS